MPECWLKLSPTYIKCQDVSLKQNENETKNKNNNKNRLDIED